MASRTSDSTNFRAMRRIGSIVTFIYRLGYIIRFFHKLLYIFKCQLRKLRGLDPVVRVGWSDNDILNSSAVHLASRIRSRDVTSELVVQTFIDRIKEVNPMINAVVADNYQQAMRRAREARFYIQLIGTNP